MGFRKNKNDKHGIDKREKKEGFMKGVVTREFDTFIISKLVQALKMLNFFVNFLFSLDVLCRSVV